MKDLIIDSQYFPCLAYISAINNSNRVIINDKELFNKQSYRNRCTILGANGTMDLIAQIDHQSPRKMSKIELNYSDRWISVHNKSIESAYKRSPYFDYFAQNLLLPLNSNISKLIDLNTATLTAILKVLQIDKEIIFLSDIENIDKENTIDLSGKIHPKKSEYNFEYKPYHQVFSDLHHPNLSILDAIFCIGRETQLIL
jgi:WbqC-like protein family